MNEQSTTRGRATSYRPPRPWFAHYNARLWDIGRLRIGLLNGRHLSVRRYSPIGLEFYVWRVWGVVDLRRGYRHA